MGRKTGGRKPSLPAGRKIPVMKTIRISLPFVLILLLLAAHPSFAGAELASFPGSGQTADGKQLELTGKLVKPDGAGPFPAVILVHGCAGTHKLHDIWAERFVKWGYAALILDSFGPRGIIRVCDDGKTMAELLPARAQDAYDAKNYLSKLPFVSKNRIAVAGWSHGGSTVIEALRKDDPKGGPFNAAVAFYPWCEWPMWNLDAPLLVLIGGSDDWTPAERCLQRMPSADRPTRYETVLNVYPGAYHTFDNLDQNMLYLGHRLVGNPAATADAVETVRSFLAKHLD